jgi:DnaJ family protein C protein 9
MSPRNIIESAFGPGCNLYSDVLQCNDASVSKAGLRKAYYRVALQHHPDRNTENLEEHKQKFQAISLAYQLLSNDEARADYDATKSIPHESFDDDDEPSKDFTAWKDYFTTIFGKVTTTQIDAFATKYKCSDEEKRDVLKQFTMRQGNLLKVLECVMLSSPRDAQRWVEDYILPAMEAGEVDKSLKGIMDKSLKKCQNMVEKELQEEEEDEDDEEDEMDEDATETEESESESPAKPASSSKPAKKMAAAAASNKASSPSPKKANKTQAKQRKPKSKQEDNNMDSLIAAIQNKRASSLAHLAMKYGGKLQEDPFADDDAFAKAQAKVDKNKKKQRRS